MTMSSVGSAKRPAAAGAMRPLREAAGRKKDQMTWRTKGIAADTKPQPGKGVHPLSVCSFVISNEKSLC